MSAVLAISIIFLMISFGLMIAAAKAGKEEIFGVGAIVFLSTVIFGFGFLCCSVKVKDLPTVYLEPESVFQDTNYLIAVKDHTSHLTGEARLIEKSKTGVVKIVQKESLNSYNKSVEKIRNICVLTKEEWEAINTTLEKK